MIIPFEGFTPKISDHVYIAPGANIIGKVEIGEYSSVWFNSILRGDIDSITIGKGQISRTFVSSISIKDCRLLLKMMLPSVTPACFMAAAFVRAA
jgi:carbonic anhydrase/acetyltransferase-like protein (isoleucine patch superfamily)